MIYPFVQFQFNKKNDGFQKVHHILPSRIFPLTIFRIFAYHSSVILANFLYDEIFDQNRHM